MSRRALTGGRLLRRQLLTDPATIVLVAVVVAVVSGLLTVWPRAVQRMQVADVTAAASATGPLQRDLQPTRVAWWSVIPVPDAATLSAELESVGPAVDEVLADIGAPLVDVVGPTQVIAETADLGIEDSPRPGGNLPDGVSLRYDPVLAEHVEIVQGRAPGEWDARALLGWQYDGDLPAGLPALEVVVSERTAQEMDWRVDEVRRLSLPGIPSPHPVRLVGTFRPLDPDADRWAHQPGGVQPAVWMNEYGDSFVYGYAYIARSALPFLHVAMSSVLLQWVPVDPLAVGAADPEALATQLRGLRSSADLSTELVGLLDAARQRSDTVTTVVAVLAAGPLGLALAVLWLGASLAVQRRRAALMLMRARGASAWALRRSLAVQGLVVALPAAVLGVAAALWAVPGPLRPDELVGPGVVVLAPVVAMAVAARPAAPGRSDLGTRRWRWRWVAEAAVAGLAAAALVGLTQRDGIGGGTDPLLVASPVLVALLVALVVVRVYPVPLRLATARLRRRGSLGPFLGAAQAARSPSGGTAPVLAGVLGAAIVVLSLVTWSTVQTGAAASVMARTGADLRAEWWANDPGVIDELVQVPGVAAITAVEDDNRQRLTDGDRAAAVDVLLVDAAALAEIHAGLPAAPEWASVLAEATAAAAPDDPVPALVGRGVGLDLARPLQLGPLGADHPVPVAGVAEVGSVPGVTNGTSFVVMDRASWERHVEVPAAMVSGMLIGLQDGADPAAVRSALAEIDSSLASAISYDDVADQLLRAPLIGGLRVALLTVLGASAAGAAAVVVLLLALGARGRGRTAALLSTLGAPGRLHGRLLVWEVVPTLAVAGVAGAAVGVALPWLVLARLDLALFTGGGRAPAPVLDPVLLGGAAAVAVAGTAVALLVAGRAARRVAAVAVLREGAET